MPSLKASEPCRGWGYCVTVPWLTLGSPQELRASLYPVLLSTPQPATDTVQFRWGDLMYLEWRAATVCEHFLCGVHSWGEESKQCLLVIIPAGLFWDLTDFRIFQQIYHRLDSAFTSFLSTTYFSHSVVLHQILCLWTLDVKLSKQMAFCMGTQATARLCFGQ